MRVLLLSFALTVLASMPASAEDEQPLFGSEGTGILAISLPQDTLAAQQRATLPASTDCTSEGCPLLQKAAMAAPSLGQQP